MSFLSDETSQQKGVSQFLINRFLMCKTILTLYNVCAVPWGVLSTVGGVQYRGGYHDKCGGIS